MKKTLMTSDEFCQKVFKSLLNTSLDIAKIKALLEVIEKDELDKYFSDYHKKILGKKLYSYINSFEDSKEMFEKCAKKWESEVKPDGRGGKECHSKELWDKIGGIKVD